MVEIDRRRDQRTQSKARSMCDDIMSADQKQVVHAAMGGNSILLSGPGGTGKTWVVKEIVRRLRAAGRNVAVTAMTGVAAINMGGGASTVHSYLGIGLGKGSADSLSAQIFQKKPHILSRWKALDVLIIDEISMMSPELFDKLNEMAKNFRHGPLRRRLLAGTTEDDRPPWGGIQLILVGDFLQLPPIDKNRTFEAKTWAESIGSAHLLTTNHRQSSDSEYRNILSHMRLGTLTDAMIARINQRVCPAPGDGIKPTFLCSRNDMARSINSRELDRLRDSDPDLQSYLFCAEIDRSNKKYPKQKMDREVENCIMPRELELCVGAQVMLLRNMYWPENRRSDGTLPDFYSDPAASLTKVLRYCNGSRGVVIGFGHDAEDNLCPRVKFARDGGVLIISPQEQKFITISDSGIETTNFTITQFPLKVAYAVTIHKAQGLTLDRARIDTSGCFLDGHTYVAFSRVKSLQSVYLTTPLKRAHLKTDTKALAYYKGLSDPGDEAHCNNI